MHKPLGKWHSELSDKGLVIIDINNGKIDKLDALKKYHVKEKTAYAVAWDQGEKTCNTYGVQAYPAQYLIGVDGNVLWEGFAMESDAKLKEVEGLIKAEVDKVTAEEREKIKKEKEEQKKDSEKK
jgi:hypothetical protein